MTILLGQARYADCPGFEIYFYDKPFDEVVGWVGGHRRYEDLTGPKTIFTKMGRHIDLDVSKKIPVVPALDVRDWKSLFAYQFRLISDLALRNWDPLCRVYEVAGCEGITVIEHEYLLHDQAFPYQFLAKMMEGEFFAFLYAETEPGSFCASLRAVGDGKPLRTIDVTEEGGWSYYEQGTPRSWEDLENYAQRLKKKRLNAEILLTYLDRLGLNYPAYRDRRFTRAVEFSARRRGYSLERYDHQADVFAAKWPAKARLDKA